MTPTQQQLCTTLTPYIAQYHEWLGFYKQAQLMYHVLTRNPLPDTIRIEYWENVEDAWFWVIAIGVWTAEAHDEPIEWLNEVLQACCVIEGVF